MSRKIFFLALLFISVSCSKTIENKIDAKAAVRLDLEFNKSYSSHGTISIPVWKSNDKAALADASTGEVSLASPILLGAPSSMFLFNFNSISEGQTILGYYPSDASINIENGKFSTVIPAEQSGQIEPLFVGTARYSKSLDSKMHIDLKPLSCILFANVSKGNYTISSATLRGNKSELIAGKISLNAELTEVSASEKSITVNLSTPVDCKNQGALIAFSVAPVVLENGYTIDYVTTTGETFSYVAEKKVEMKRGEAISTGSAHREGTRLVFCGSDKIYQIDADLAESSGVENALLWQWNAVSASPIIGLPESRCNHLDDCKPVDNNTKILATSSYGWCVLLDIARGEILFNTTQAKNAHSAELLPGGRVAVACSSGGDCIQIYDINQPGKILFSAPLLSAHGVVWSEKHQRLYAVGGTTLVEYSLEKWDTSTPELKTENNYKSTIVTALHDLTVVDDNNLLLAGSKAALFNLNNKTFTALEHFSKYTDLKSVNYNAMTGEAWYTDATVPEGSQTWSTQTIRYTSDVNGTVQQKNIKVKDIDMYKVRVMNW